MIAKTLLHTLQISLIGFLSCLPHASLMAASEQSIAALESTDTAVAAPFLAPLRRESYALKQLAQGERFKLLGIHNTQYLEFTVRRDQVVTQAELDLVFTPSPALLPKVSHVRVYLNDEMMGVVPIEEAQAGQQVSQTVTLNPRMMMTFNRIRLEFVGHYTDICEDPAHSSVWLDISHTTQIRIEQQALAIANELSFFPEPFFDAGDMQAQSLPFIFAEAPSSQQLQAGAILSSYFGSQAQWRELSFPVHYNQIAQQHMIVFANNSQRPDFLKDYPQVTGPVVDLISVPDHPYHKMLLVLGRDDSDLITAATALAVGHPLFRGQSVSVNAIEDIAPRQPYDAPNWVNTERPVFFSELISYPGQLEVSGLMPRPITLNLNLPPDLFIWRNQGIPTSVIYRYSPPSSTDDSRLNLSINDNYIQSYSLRSSSDQGLLNKLRLPLRDNERASTNQGLLIPALKVGMTNQLRFDFFFASTIGSAQRDTCQTVLPVDVRAALDKNSMIDFSGFRHYLAMPNLYAFSGSAFPFSRMADLSETVVVLPATPSPAQARLALEVMGKMGAQIGYPALKVRIMTDWAAASALDADILLIGSMPQALHERTDANLLLQGTQSRLRQARVAPAARQDTNSRLKGYKAAEQDAISVVDVRALAPLAAVVGLESEHYPQRSIVALLASTQEDFSLLRKALSHQGLREQIKGSVALVRESGVTSHQVGAVYYVGELPWWERLWYHLSDRPLTLAGTAFLVVLLLAIILWRTLGLVARRRLQHDA